MEIFSHITDRSHWWQIGITFIKCLEPKIILHRCQILRLVNKPQFTMATGSEHVVVPYIIWIGFPLKWLIFHNQSCQSYFFYNFLLDVDDLSSYSRRVIMESAEYMTDVLLYTINKNHDAQERVFSQIILLIYDLLQAPSLTSHLHKSIMQDHLTFGFGLPNLYKELYTKFEKPD